MSKPTPTPSNADRHASIYPLPNDDSGDWLRAGFVNDKFSAHCQRAQGRPFLRTGVRPAAGHRVELTLFLNSDRRGRMPFRLSGEVVDDRASLAPGFGRPAGVSEEDTAAGGIHPDSLDDNWRPSTSTEDSGLNGGSLALSHMVRALIVQRQPSLDVTPTHLSIAWEDSMSHEQKEKISNVVIKKLGARHGQKVLCEGR